VPAGSEVPAHERCPSPEASASSTLSMAEAVALLGIQQPTTATNAAHPAPLQHLADAAMLPADAAEECPQTLLTAAQARALAAAIDHDC
jgi:hypothetical protein